MEMLELMKQRHSVRQYTSQNIDETLRNTLREYIKELNKESGLHIQIFFDEPKCFNSMLAHYGRFKNVTHYICIVGNKKDPNLDIKTGYYGEKLVLKIQELGLNTCWVKLTKGKTQAIINKDEKLNVTISLGYGVTQGVPHKDKPLDEVMNTQDAPEWFMEGMKAVMLAPTAVNQQKFYFTYKNNEVHAKAFKGICSQMDLGIVKYHFEAVTGREVILD